MKKVTVYLLILAICLMGCTGSFKLTREVYHFHRSQQKWADEAIFLICAIAPVYWFTLLADGIVLNSIEFWTGKNPVTSNVGTQNAIAQNGQEKVLMKYDAAKDTVEVSPIANKGNTLILSRTNEGVVALDNKGNVLFTSKEDIKGGVTIFDAKNHVVNYFSPDVVEKERTQLFQN